MSAAKTYTKPTVVDYGTLRELTAACALGTGGDAFAPSGSANGVTYGTSNPAFGCTSN